ncbi:hypothetical protein PHSY_002888 [Pseudozyma hubeiensis SY62]|uniref:Uncharacterized protein n=1 Tax=Pseudozyma hubeiensis (strain SY62) TaxID=1305764 RepID=R9P1X1_PSEHS|nr:hypothetical protein PHSY_002888 [Pseudozyma hubeiensis SY62]GAC95313.1 hypothetical protein PHSY_002888 [Pseudozyma hubeiensis SY62]
MGRLTQGHFDDVFLSKIKQACVRVLDQLNEANEIDQAFDLCSSVSRRNRVILSFLHDADQGRSSSVSSSSTSPPVTTLLPHNSVHPSREASIGTDSVASLSAQRRRRAREMQYVRDPNDSNDDSDSQATVGPSSSSRAHLDPSSARNPSMSQPDYTFEQFADHLDPTDKLLKRSLEIIIKETARQALARKRGPAHDPASASATSGSRDPAASLRSAIASSRADRGVAPSRLLDDETGFAHRMSRVLNIDSASSSRRYDTTTTDLDPTYQLLRSLRPASHPLNHASDRTNAAGSAERRTLRNFLPTSSDGLLGSTRDLLTSSQDSPSFAPRVARPITADQTLALRDERLAPAPHPATTRDSPEAQLSHRRSVVRPSSSISITPQTISARLAEASRRNAEAARTIVEAERLRSSQFIRTSIESLRASLFQLHMDLACTQLQNAQRDSTRAHRASANHDVGASYALVMDTIELFDDTLRRLSCLVSTTDHTSSSDPEPSVQDNAPRNADPSRMRTSMWRARNLLLLSSMSRRPDSPEGGSSSSEPSGTANSHDAELRAHQHLLATIQESHWTRADVPAPSSGAIRAWRRKLAAWYYLDRDSATYPDAPDITDDRTEAYARWHPDLELPYAIDDEIMASSTRPDPIADPRAAWQYARRHDDSIRNDLNRDEQVRYALASSSVASALQQLQRLRSQHDGGPQQGIAGQHSSRASPGEASALAEGSAEEADPDVSLTRTTSLSRRNAVRPLPLNNSDSSSIRSARSSLSLRRLHGSSGANASPSELHTALQYDNDAAEEEIVETSIEISTVPHSPQASADPTSTQAASSATDLLPPPDRPRAERSGSFTFVTTPAAVLRSRQRSESRSHVSTERPAADDIEGEGDDNDDGDTDAEEYIDLDLDLGMAGDYTFDFDLTDFLRSESRRLARRRDHDDGDDDDELDRDGVEASPRALRRRRSSARDADGSLSGDASPADIRVYVSGSGASTPAEARQATFEAYAQRARLLERRRRMDGQREGHDGDAAVEATLAIGDRDDANASHETSPDSRRRRRGRAIGGDGTPTDGRDSLPFTRRTSER